MKIFRLFSLLNRTRCYKIDISTISKEVETVNQCQVEPKESAIKCRHAVALMGFSVYVFLSIHRMNMTVSIVAMVNPSPPTTNISGSLLSCPVPSDEAKIENITHYNTEKRNGEFDWSPEVQGYILASGFIGYFLTQFIAGKLSEVYGCKWIIVGGVFIASVTTFVTPFVSWWNVYILIFAQTLRGMAQGVYQPAISVLIANWFPVMERGSLFTFMMSGNGMGALAGGLISGYLCESSFGGWPSVFYSCGAVGIIAAFFMAVFLYENPAVHPNISKTELKFILSNQESKLSHRRPSTPWRSIFTSVPIYALAVAYFGQNWAGAHFLAVHPTFLGNILHFPIAQNGVLTSVPFLLQTVFTLAACGASNVMLKNNCVSIDKARKLWNFMSCLGYSLCLLGIYFAKCNRTISVAFSFLAMASIGFAYAGCMIVPADMSPTFAGSVMGITSTLGTAAGFVLPVIVGSLTDGRQTLEQWDKILFISIAVVMASGIVFCIFGSAEVQSWNYVQENVSEKEEKRIYCENNETSLNVNSLQI